METINSEKLLGIGAEAHLYIIKWFNVEAIKKVRVPKKYRDLKLDLSIRTSRTVREAKLLTAARSIGVPTPVVYYVNIDDFTIIMEYVKGQRLKELFPSLSGSAQKEICLKIGELIALLHENGIVHGDLTTSNMILHESGHIFLIDFGLGEFTYDIEARGVDLHLMMRALESTHYNIAKECFKHIIEGYCNISGEGIGKSVLLKVSEIRSRGRYIRRRVIKHQQL